MIRHDNKNNYIFVESCSFCPMRKGKDNDYISNFSSKISSISDFIRVNSYIENLIANMIESGASKEELKRIIEYSKSTIDIMNYVIMKVEAILNTIKLTDNKHKNVKNYISNELENIKDEWEDK